MRSVIAVPCALIFMFASTECGGGLNVAGKWTGKMIQPDGPQGQEGYSLLIQLRQNGTRVSGTARISIPRSEYFGVMKVEGELHNDTLYYREVAVIDQKPRGRWCLKEGALKIERERNGLSGSWHAEGCSSGTIDVFRTGQSTPLEESQRQDSSIGQRPRLYPDSVTVHHDMRIYNPDSLNRHYRMQYAVPDSSRKYR